MSDQTASKPMWKRHQACNTRVFNHPIDWEGHLRNCPYDIRKDLNKAIEQLEELSDVEQRLAALEQAEAPEPAMDAYAVEDDLDDSSEQTSQYADEDLDAAAHDEQLEPAADTGNIRQIRSHVDDYFTGPGGGAA